jgi:four helix bundle protein
VLAVYAFTAAFPKQETYGLTLQMRRSAVSIPANIAEGFRRRGKADKARFMNLAEGSVEESRYYLILASDLGYGDSNILSWPHWKKSAGCLLPTRPRFCLLSPDFLDFYIPQDIKGCVRRDVDVLAE